MRKLLAWYKSDHGDSVQKQITWRRTKSDYDSEHKTQTYILKSYIFINNPFMCVNKETVETDSYQAYNKLQTQTIENFQILWVRDKTAVIDDNGNPETKRINHATYALSILRIAPTSSKLQRFEKPNPLP